VTARAETPCRASAHRTQFVSVGLVIVTALVLDVLAEGSLAHAIPVGVTACAVGLLRLVAGGRLPRFFALVNVAVLAQPAVHALAQVAHTAAGELPHSHVVAEEVWAVALQVAITLIVVLVAASEPVLDIVVSTRLAALRVLLAFTIVDPPVAPAARPIPAPPPREPSEVLRARCRPRRGPPRAAATEVVPATSALRPCPA
jgi:hypothetical protein